MSTPEEIELNLVKKYRKTIWNKFLRGIKDYQLIQEGDKIAVCISGGKDSMVMAKCMQRLQRYSKFPFEVVYLVMNPGYNERNKQKIIDNAKTLGIPIQMFETKIFNVVADMEDSPCYICARMRRGHLYKNAQDLGCNKIALGHHFDDVIETNLMSMLYSGQIRTMMPKLHSENYEGMEIIRPLYLVKEADIISWAKYNNLEFIQCACRFTENREVYDDGTSNSKRQEMKELINKFRQINPFIEYNIFRSMQNVQLEKLIAYKDGDEYHSFLDNYDNPNKDPKSRRG